MARENNNSVYHLSRRGGFLWNGMALILKARLMLFLVAVANNLSEHHTANAMTQSHQGSAQTKDFFLNAKLPSARIEIKTSSFVNVINVDLPPPTPTAAVSLEEELEWKVSLELLAMQLCEPAQEYNGDKLKVIYSDPTTIKSTTWKHNVSDSVYATSNFSYEAATAANENRELKDIQANQIIMIPEGRWTMSRADILATLYQDPSIDNTCPEETFPCSCDNTAKSDNDNSLEEETENVLHPQVVVTRCIPKSLVCNGQPNCGFGCLDDESVSFCKSSSSSGYTSSITDCVPSTTTTTQSPPLLGSGNGAEKVVPKTAAIFASSVGVIIFINLISKAYM